MKNIQLKHLYFCSTSGYIGSVDYVVFLKSRQLNKFFSHYKLIQHAYSFRFLSDFIFLNFVQTYTIQGGIKFEFMNRITELFFHIMVNLFKTISFIKCWYSIDFLPVLLALINISVFIICTFTLK